MRSAAAVPIILLAVACSGTPLVPGEGRLRFNAEVRIGMTEEASREARVKLRVGNSGSEDIPFRWPGCGAFSVAVYRDRDGKDLVWNSLSLGACVLSAGSLVLPPGDEHAFEVRIPVGMILGSEQPDGRHYYFFVTPQFSSPALRSHGRIAAGSALL
jgi:hypothetical protein